MTAKAQKSAGPAVRIMDEDALDTLIAEAAALDQEVADKDKLLKEIKASIREQAEVREHEIEGNEGEKRSWKREIEVQVEVPGSQDLVAEQIVCEITWPLPSVRTLTEGKDKDDVILDRLSEVKKKLFDRTVSYKPKSTFREIVGSLFKGKNATKVLDDCTSPSAARVAFKRK